MSRTRFDFICLLLNDKVPANTIQNVIKSLEDTLSWCEEIIGNAKKCNDPELIEWNLTVAREAMKRFQFLEMFLNFTYEADQPNDHLFENDGHAAVRSGPIDFAPVNTTSPMEIKQIQKFKQSVEDFLRQISQHKNTQMVFNKNNRSYLMQDLLMSIQRIDADIQSCTKSNDKYSHINPNDIEEAKQILEETKKWYDDTVNYFDKLQPHDDPTVLYTHIKKQQDALEKKCSAILNKPNGKIEQGPKSSLQTSEE